VLIQEGTIIRAMSLCGVCVAGRVACHVQCIRDAKLRKPVLPCCGSTGF
jgi:hypothetical protein